MFVAQDQENGQMFGPFTSEAKGEAWALAYVTTVEGVKYDPTETGNSVGDFLARRLWLVQEVTYVDEDDRDFGDWLGDQASLTPVMAPGGAEPAGFDEVQPRCDFCGLAQALEGEDWNGETGNHISCEERERADQPRGNSSF